jgi:2-polyprenyl-3-methyl-5-hydroxy-6-metoxy-1,4-benzoquinol methylase
MLAPSELPEEYETWNRRWGSPHGRRAGLRRWAARVGLSSIAVQARLGGPFAFQMNSPTRAFEYPWMADHLRTAHRLLEVGGALSGLQFVLDNSGAEVHNVDPFFDYGNGPGEYAQGPVERHRALNAVFDTKVQLHHSTLPEAKVDGPFDAIFSVSTLEHMPTDAVKETLDRVDSLLRPGGRLLLTIDLFLDVAPFTSGDQNRWGRNISVGELVAQTGYELEVGRTSELHGFADFAADRLVDDTSRYLRFESQMAQLLVLRKT